MKQRRYRASVKMEDPLFLLLLLICCAFFPFRHFHLENICATQHPVNAAGSHHPNLCLLCLSRYPPLT